MYDQARRLHQVAAETPFFLVWREFADVLRTERKKRVSDPSQTQPITKVVFLEGKFQDVHRTPLRLNVGYPVGATLVGADSRGFTPVITSVTRRSI